ncbi:MAG: asparagine synthase (glutamine-hydrolyzing) [bacterium]|nr:asparagine synthase (glutamine-hydrolyzing) [bacterium]
MCGIFGITGETALTMEKSKIDSMLSSLSMRGPDDHGVERHRNCILGHTRLSILDLAQGHQPMRDGERDITITFNGEIYNYLELKTALQKRGHAFSTKSDTEVILKAYREYGEECPAYLEGMFAFAIWDEEKKTLFCARDRFGEKPFYYAATRSGGYIFGSEIKSLIASGEIDPKISREAIDIYLSLMYIPPHMSVYENVSVLPPASLLIVKDGVLATRKYWELEKKTLDTPYAVAKMKTKELLERSVKKMMAADVEVGTFLSGGVDSTLVTHFAQATANSPVKTFSVGYEDYINELPFAKEASEKFGTDHYTLQAKGEMTDHLMEISRYLDEPHADPANLAQYLVSKFARSKVKVTLTGDGADELFMGYGWYWKHHNLSWKAHFLDKALSHPFKNFIKGLEVFTPREKSFLWGAAVKSRSFVPDAISGENLGQTEKVNLFDLTFYLPGKLLSKVDRIGMMNSLETRCPFLDREFAEFAYNLPEHFKIDRKSGKLILKDLLSDIMPKEFVYRRKQGFGAPIDKWLRSEKMESFVRKTLSGTIPKYTYLKKEEVMKVLRIFYDKKDDAFSYKVWALLCLALWFDFHPPRHE